MHDEIMTGLNPSADNRLAADLGVRLVGGDSIEKIIEDTRKFYFALGFSKGLCRATELTLLEANTTMTRDTRDICDAHLAMCDRFQKEREANTAELLTLVDQAKEAGLVS